MDIKSVPVDETTERYLNSKAIEVHYICSTDKMKVINKYEYILTALQYCYKLGYIFGKTGTDIKSLLENGEIPSED
jgi:hypothetical protein